jgi:hypothetical protein
MEQWRNLARNATIEKASLTPSFANHIMALVLELLVKAKSGVIYIPVVNGSLSRIFTHATMIKVSQEMQQLTEG